METLKHYTECLDKKIIGDCIIEQNYNEAIAEIKMLTGRDLLYIDNDVLCSSCAYSSCYLKKITLYTKNSNYV